MSRSLVHRLTRLEQQAQARDLASWDVVHAAEERLRTSARDGLDALLSGCVRPHAMEAQAQADGAILDRWCAAHGVSMDGDGARLRVRARLTTMAARYAADAPR